MLDKNYWLWLICMVFLCATGLFLPLVVVFFIYMLFKAPTGRSSNMKDNNAHNDGVDD